MLGLLWMTWVNTWRALHNLRVRLRRRPGPWLHMRVDGPLPELAATPPWWQRRLQGRVAPLSIHVLHQRFRAVARTPRIPGVVLDLRDLEAGWAQVEALREEVAWLRAQGKEVVAYVHQADMRTYMAAAACNRIVMAPSAVLSLAGFRVEQLYLKDALERVGIQADVFAVSPYKSAYDPVVRSDMSPEQREQLERITDGRMAAWCDAVARARNVEPVTARAWVDRGMFSAEAAVGAGLVDAALYLDELGPQLVGAGKVSLATWESAQGSLWRPPRRRARRLVAVVPVHGTMMQGSSRRTPVPLPVVGETQAGADSIIRALRTAEHDPRVSAVVLHLDTPGGDAYAADLVWREVARVNQRKPVVASMGNAAASGGYYVAAPCRRILARAATLTGSIGVVAIRPRFRGLMDLLGARPERITRGERAGMFGTVEPLTASEREAWNAHISHAYGMFLDRVVTGRKMERARVEPLAGGRVWLGTEAVAHGLVDGVGGLRDAIHAARELAGLPADEFAPWLPMHGGDGAMLPEPWPTQPLKSLEEAARALSRAGAWAVLPWHDEA